jgi:acyl-CoA hydrolase
MPAEKLITRPDLKALATSYYEQLDGHIVMGIPIGIGKSAALVNAFYQVAKDNPHFTLSIHTALSLGRPKTKSDLERRLLDPFFDRQFEGIDELDYVLEGREKRIPKNIRIVEFYFKPGEMLKNPGAQQNVLSANYTHVARDMINRDVNLLIQSISKKVIDGTTHYSLSSNPDVSLDLQRLMRQQTRQDGRKRLLLAQVNPNLPYMPNDADVPESFFDEIVDDPSLYTPLFCTPHQPISPVDHMIGFYTSAMVKDAGTLQIGIGSLGDAVVNSLLVRHKKNADYRQLLENANALEKFPVIEQEGGWETFETGLYGNTEMLVPGYLELKHGDVLKRRVYDDVSIQKLINNGLAPTQIDLEWIDALLGMERIDPVLTKRQFDYLQYWGIFSENVTFQDGSLSHQDGTETTNRLTDHETRSWLAQKGFGEALKHARLIHAGFFVGNHHFYDDLRNMPASELNEINMTSVAFTNQLHGDEPLKLEQRHHARFINACMKMTLAGAAVSDGLANGQVVSGVGGQFNFVSMAHDIPDARSILMMRSCRTKGTKTISNIVFNYGHVTVPRHMRDIVITEYGIADLRAKNDQEIIEELLKVADSRFQPELIRQAQAAGKLPADFVLPESALFNTPEAIAELIQGHLAEDFSPFPFGRELTDQEVLIGGALKRLKAQAAKKWPLVKVLLSPESKLKRAANKQHLKRMGLYDAKGLKEKIMRKLVLSELPEGIAAPKAARTPTTAQQHHS